MAGKWHQQRWGDLAVLEYGKGLTGYGNGKSTYRVFGTNGPIGWTSEPLCTNPTVVVGRKGAYRGIHFSSEPCFVIDTAFYLVPKVDFDMKWAYYELLTHDINAMDSGSAIPSTSRDSFYLLSVNVPPLPEQRAIADILGSFDDKIALNQEMNITLEKIGQTLFKHWFIDFEFPNEKGKPYKSSGGEIVYVEDIGQELPKGWKWGLISDLVNHSKDTISPYVFPEKTFFHYSIPSYDEGKWPSVEKGKSIKSNKFLVKTNSILVSKLNPRMPRIWAVGEIDESNSVCSTELQVFVPKKKWNYSYVYFSFNSGEMKDEMESLVTGTSGSHQRVRPEDMLNLKIVIPDEDVLQKFEDIGYCLQEKKWQLDTENKHLCSIRDSLLPRLMSGQIRVPVG